mmetsp:Transcript_2229/g.4686  ORF Transcript_2229/g.4686 Transcript_2229/m.4686 type:complete len:96 (-) Transcript_2229:579-866(-)
MIPTNVGGSPRQKPGMPSTSKIFLAIADGLDLTALEDWSCVLTTSSGLVIQAATVPAAPPDSSFKDSIRRAVMVLTTFAAAVDPPRTSDSIVLAT